VPVPGAAPLLFVRQRADGAYRSRVTDLGAFVPAALTIFHNPEVRARFSPRRLNALHRAGQAEKAWIAGRAMLETGRRDEGLRLLRWSVRVNPTPRRVALLVALHLLGLAHASSARRDRSSVIRRTPISNVK
jgi:hypothetical protein